MNIFFEVGWKRAMQKHGRIFLIYRRYVKAVHRRYFGS